MSRTRGTKAVKRPAKVTPDLLSTIDGLTLQARLEPQKFHQCICMIARVIARHNRRHCEICQKRISNGDKFHYTKNGVKHRNCDHPSSYDCTNCDGIRHKL